MRDAYDRFLLKFPLLFGYWKKYADLEFNISGPESAEMVSYILISPPPPPPDLNRSLLTFPTPSTDI